MSPSYGDPVSSDSPTIGPESPTTHAGSSGGPPSAVTGPLTQGQSFGTRYHIIRILGVGGMGAVYQAWDDELGVAVAIKVIRPEAMRDPRAAAEVERRFKRELLLARQVTHKNVVRIHDIGEINGIKYITMAYVKGVDLATRLKQDGKLSVAEVLPIARAIISGLTAAHAAGVVHRDLKPANIIISDEGEALIMDFGIARSSGGRAPATRPDGIAPSTSIGPITRVVEATMMGVIVGTIEYMAPEQARGVPVDQRADIYSLGLILYDALAGRYRSVGAQSAVAELEGRMVKPPPPIKTVAPEVPEPLDRIVSRCLEPDPEKRYQTIEALAADLERLDAHGQLIPVKRVVGVRMLAAVVLLAVGVLGGIWYYARSLVPPPPHDPVSVIIADVRNSTGDPTLDHTLEPALKIALEGAGFITAFDRTQMSNLGVPAVKGVLDEAAARTIAVNQGLGVVVAGALERQGRGYRISFNAIQPVTGTSITQGESTVSTKEQVMTAVTSLAAVLRKGLGDETSESAKRFAMETLSTTSLDVIHEYAEAMEALATGRNADARRHGAKAAELDANFGAAYGVMAAASEALGEHQAALDYSKQAVARLDRVTERERYRIRGVFFLLNGDQEKCVEEYTALIKRYASDTAAHNNLAICAKNLRNLPKAVEEMQRAVAILPKRARYRGSLALYAAYAGDFQTAEREALETQKLNASYTPAFRGLSFAQLGQGRLTDVADTIEALRQVDAELGATGLADLYLYQGRFAESLDLYEKTANANVAAKNLDAAAEQFSSAAYVQLARGEENLAAIEAEKALSYGKTTKVRFLSGRILAEAGDVERAQALAEALSSQIQAEPRAYGKIIEGDIALRKRDARAAIAALTEANKLVDTWIGRFDLGRAYLAAEAYTQADSEFDRCLKRRGEALSLFMDAVPTYGYLPPVYYYQGRVREGLSNAGFGDSYRTYLAIRGDAGEDRLLAEVRQRAGQ